MRHTMLSKLHVGQAKIEDWVWSYSLVVETRYNYTNPLESNYKTKTKPRGIRQVRFPR